MGLQPTKKKTSFCCYSPFFTTKKYISSMLRFFCLVVFLFGGNVLKGEQKLGKESVGGVNLKGQSQILNININIYIYTVSLSLSLSLSL